MKDRVQTRREFLKAACVGSAALMASCRSLTRSGGVQDRPNVILIMTDDQGYGDFGVTGNPILRTPNVDAMAARSGSMENFYVHPVCAPTRACLMTGRYNYRTRAIDTYVGRAMMEPEEVTIAEMLRDAGYATGIFGKWHLGDCYPMRPMDQGFEQSLVHRGGGIGQPSDPPGGKGKYTDPILFDNGEQIQCHGYCTDVYFDRAMDWIEQCQDQKRNFFAYIPTNAPHGPFGDVPAELLDYYKQQDLSNQNFPQNVGHPLPEKCNEDVRARIFAMITNIDDNVGRLFEKLDDLKLTRETIVIFMVDNGPDGRRYVAGMAGAKTGVHEGGIRSPFFVQWPDVIQPGHSSDRIAAHIDVMPTLLEACGVRKSVDLKLDGRSLLPLLKGEQVDWPDRTLFIQTHRGDRPVRYHHFAARSQRWKLLHASGFGKESFVGRANFELYDMESDPLEEHNLVRERPEIAGRMLREYKAWFDDVSSTRPDNYAPPRIHIGTAHENPVVLTRQDWRHAEGRPWAPDSNGYWELYAATPGEYSVRLRFPEAKTAGQATLEMGAKTLTKDIATDATECTFDSVPQRKGNLRLLTTLTFPQKSKGPWQVDVFAP
jgi:arylsulfatase A-like enzyme